MKASSAELITDTDGQLASSLKTSPVDFLDDANGQAADGVYTGVYQYTAGYRLRESVSCATEEQEVKVRPLAAACRKAITPL